jgi:TRAP-type C4-dicarboxylate transport system substrate-binding protein
MHRIRFISSIFLITFVAIFLPLTANSQPTPQIKTWRAASHSQASNPSAKAVEKFCKLVEERTKGVLKITFYPSEMLMAADDQVAAVMRGSLQIAAGTPGYDGRGVPFKSPFSQPFLGLTYEDWKPLAERGAALRTITEQAYENAGLKLLVFYLYAEEVVASAKRPLVRIEDFKGLKIRVTGAAKAQGFKLLGAEPVALSGGEAAEALRKGMIEAASVDISATLARRYYEFSKYINRWNVSTVAETLYVNRAAYDGLPKEIQNVVLSTSNEIETMMWKEVQQMDELGALKTKGMIVNQIPKSELVRASQATQPLQNKWIEEMGATGQKIRDILDKARGK